MATSQVHFSSTTDLWSTPQEFFDKLNAEFNFDIDVCATLENTKCGKFFTKNDDGLAQVWLGVCWMNPPYGREIGAWMRKADEAARGGQRLCVSCLRAQTRSGGTTTRYITKSDLSKGDSSSAMQKIARHFQARLL